MLTITSIPPNGRQIALTFDACRGGVDEALLDTLQRNNVPAVEPHRDGYSFGLGVAVRMHPGVAATPGSRGDYSWNGAYGTQFWADPQERLVVVVGTVAPGDIRKYYREQMGALVYGAMTDLRSAGK